MSSLVKIKGVPTNGDVGAHALRIYLQYYGIIKITYAERKQRVLAMKVEIEGDEKYAILDTG